MTDGYRLPANFSENTAPSVLTPGYDAAVEEPARVAPLYPRYPTETLPAVDDSSTYEPSDEELGKQNWPRYEADDTPELSKVEQAGGTSYTTEPAVVKVVTSEERALPYVEQSGTNMTRRGFLVGVGAVTLAVGLAINGDRIERFFTSPRESDPNGGGFDVPIPHEDKPQKPGPPVERENRDTERLFGHHILTATIFGIGEGPRKSNGYQEMVQSAWIDGIDQDTGRPRVVELFGGVDDPFNRTKRGLPVDFDPLHRPYYFGGVPDEFDENGLLPGVRERTPWAYLIDYLEPDESIVKGHDLVVKRDRKMVVVQCYDTAIIGGNKPYKNMTLYKRKNTVSPKKRPMLKISPAAAHELGFDVSDGDQRVEAYWINRALVPDGPWNEYERIDPYTNWV